MLAAATGAVSGEPGRAGVFGFSLQVSDAQGRLDRRSFGIEVLDPTVPTVSSFSPSSGAAGTAVTVAGTGFPGRRRSPSAACRRRSRSAFTVDSATQVTATVPAAATSGPVSVTAPGGTATSASSFVVITPGLGFYTLAPCRLVDTRLAASDLGGPVLTCGGAVDRAFTVVGPACQVPADARALSVNATVTTATAAGNLRLYPADTALPGTSTLNYPAAQSRANNAVVGLSADGRLKVRCAPAGTAHFILDVNGYFR